MIRKIYLSDDLCFEESLNHFLYKEKTTWDFIGYRQKALRVIVKANADGRRASKEELFARVYDKEYDTFYNEERDGRRIKQLIRSVRQLLTKYDIELPRANKEGYQIPIRKVETQSFGSKKQKEHISAPVCFEPSMYLEAAEKAVFEKEKYFEKEKNKLAFMRDECSDEILTSPNDWGVWFWTYRDVKAAYYYDLRLFADDENIQKAEELLKGNKADSDIEQAISEELLAAFMEMTTKDSDSKRTDEIIRLTEDAISKYEKIMEDYGNLIYAKRIGMLFQPHSQGEILSTIAWLKDNLGSFLSRTNQQLDLAEQLLKDALFFRKKDYNEIWPIENDPAIAWTCINIAELLCKIPGREKEALHYCRMAMWIGDEFKRRIVKYEFIGDMASNLYEKINEIKA